MSSEEKKKDKSSIIKMVLWLLGVGAIVAGGVMISVGIRPAFDYITSLFGAINGGEFPDLPSASEFGVAIAGIVVLFVGIVLLYSANFVSKAAKRAAQDEVKNAQMIMNLNAQYAKQEAPHGEEQAADETAPKHFCAYCGKPIEKAEYVYCPYCGKEVSRIEKELEALAVPIDVGGVEVTDEPMWGRTPVESEANKPHAKRRCLYCGAEVEDNEEVCSICGHKIRHE